MKKKSHITGLYLLVFFILPVFHALPQENESKPVISVLNFTSNNISEAETQIFTDFITSHIVETGNYRVIDRMQREALLNEIEWSYSDCTTEECQLEIGRQLAADQIIFGSLGKIENRYILNIKQVEVVTGEALNIASKMYGSMDELLDDSRNLVFRLLDRGTSGAAAIQEEPAEREMGDDPEAEEESAAREMKSELERVELEEAQISEEFVTDEETSGGTERKWFFPIGVGYLNGPSAWDAVYRRDFESWPEHRPDLVFSFLKTGRIRGNLYWGMTIPYHFHTVSFSMMYYRGWDSIIHIFDLLAAPAWAYEWVPAFEGGPEVFTFGYGFGINNYLFRFRGSAWFLGDRIDLTWGISFGYILGAPRPGQ